MSFVADMSDPFQKAAGFIDILHTFSRHPIALLALFLTGSFLMIWRLQAMESKGFEGTVLGTLIMPYCSGFANLVFAYVMSRSASNGGLVVENCLVNNVTNLTLILGMATIFGASTSVQKGRSRKKIKAPSDLQRLDGLNVLFSLIALFLFTGTLWALAKDGVIDFYDGLVLIALFVFWQILHVFEILKDKIRNNKTFQWSIVFDLMLIAISAYGVYFSTDHLVTWVSQAGNPYVGFSQLGWLSGLLMVLPNALIALYYARRGRQDIVLSSQIGDGHICIPMCIGIFAVFNAIQIPDLFQTGIYVILGAGVLHFLSVAILKRVPGILGVGLLGGYALFLYKGFVL
jgi:cation:H+ antiporter